MIVGTLGAGQLGRMLALAGYPLGLRFRCFDPTAAAPAAQVCAQIVASYDDEAALAQFASGLDVITYEFENVPVAAVRYLAQFAPVYPPPAALEVAQDRLAEKSLFRELGIPTPNFAAVGDRAGLELAICEIGLPAILKTRRGGYDGKGQAVLLTPADIELAWQQLGGEPLILEQFVAFERELSVIAVRDLAGNFAVYPLTTNHHRDGILRLSLAPATEAVAVKLTAEVYAARLLKHLGYVGVLALEMFEVDGELWANEIAPRVHNSGHWTIEGAESSQFENHLRAICGLPLGTTGAVGYSAMLNLIGGVPDLATLLAVEGAHPHLYGKEARRGRKLGHITLRADDEEELLEGLAILQPLVEQAGEG